MSFYSNGGWGAYGMQGATQGPNFYGVQPQRGSFMPSQYAGASMQNISSFYADMQRKDSFYAEGAPPLTTSAAATAALSANPRTLGSGNQLGSMSYYGELASTPATVTPAAPAEPDTPRDTPTPLQRKNSSGRILRRKVSFSGVPQTLPPEVEPRSLPQTPKRKGSRRLSATPQPTEGDDYDDGHDNDGEGVRGGGQQQQRYPQHYHQQLYQQHPQHGVQQSQFEGPPQLAGDPQQPPFWMQGPSSRPPKCGAAAAGADGWLPARAAAAHPRSVGLHAAE